MSRAAGLLVSRAGWNQLGRFGLVGLVSNLVLYAAYLALTAVGIGPKAAMSVVYITGVVQTFLVNRAWTFKFSGPRAGPFAKYCLTYASGYLLNLVLLFLLVDLCGGPHQLVQAVSILAVALLVFFMQRHWVFRPTP